MSRSRGPVGTFAGTSPAAFEVGLETGDKVRLGTGEELIVIAVGATGYLLQSLNGRGKPLMTAEELEATGAEGI